MNSDDLAFLPLKVIRTGPGGKRTFEPDGKRRLIEACLPPGVSISGMALKAGINANQLRKWILQSRKQTSLACATQALAPSPAFIPVRQIDSPAPYTQQRHAPVHSSVSPSRLSARLPNGVTVELECTGHDAALVTAMIAALGAH
jgi:transposase